jgi:FixJ family two-component response regulator
MNITGANLCANALKYVWRLEMMRGMLLGYGKKYIASTNGLMADTIKKYRGQILSKMQVNSLAELLALCKGFIPPTNNR